MTVLEDLIRELAPTIGKERAAELWVAGEDYGRSQWRAGYEYGCEITEKAAVAAFAERLDDHAQES